MWGRRGTTGMWGIRKLRGCGEYGEEGGVREYAEQR